MGLALKLGPRKAQSTRKRKVTTAGDKNLVTIRGSTFFTEYSCSSKGIGWSVFGVVKGFS